jgi:hypothetical protein
MMVGRSETTILPARISKPASPFPAFLPLLKDSASPQLEPERRQAEISREHLENATGSYYKWFISSWRSILGFAPLCMSVCLSVCLLVSPYFSTFSPLRNSFREHAPSIKAQSCLYEHNQTRKQIYHFRSAHREQKSVFRSGKSLTELYVAYGFN